MSNKKLAILGVVAVVMVIWAVSQGRIGKEAGMKLHTPAYLIQGLDPADIGSIVLGTGERAVTLKRRQKRFVVVDKDNYPAVTSKINDLIAKCLDITTAELYTDDPAAIAPALIIGLSGRPDRGARLISLNASPVGSTPILSSTAAFPQSSSARPYVNGFEMD